MTTGPWCYLATIFAFGARNRPVGGLGKPISLVLLQPTITLKSSSLGQTLVIFKTPHARQIYDSLLLAGPDNRSRHVICPHHGRLSNHFNLVQQFDDTVHNVSAAGRSLIDSDTIRILKHDSKRDSISSVEKLLGSVNLYIQVMRVNLCR